MTNEEKTKELADFLYFKLSHIDYGTLTEKFLEMAEWKDSQYPHWNSQDENDICDSVKGWECHKYVCIMKDGKVCEWIGINDEDYNGNVSTHIDPVNDEEYGVDDIMYWTEL